MGPDLSLYKKHFGLLNEEFVRIAHTGTIVSEVYKVTASDQEPYILKICPRSDDYFREAYFLKKLKTSLPVPSIIATLEPTQDNLGAILMEYIEGEHPQEGDWTPGLAYEIGQALALLHNNRSEAFGDLTQPRSLLATPKLYFYDKFEEELDECRGHLPEETIKKCSEYLERHKQYLESVDGPCIVHRDFHPGNMIVQNNHLKGIIDWSSARSGFAEQDFCSFEHFKWAPDLKPLLGGYRAIRPLPNYKPLLPLLQLGRALAILGYTFKNSTWNTTSATLHAFNRAFLDSFPFP